LTAAGDGVALSGGKNNLLYGGLNNTIFDIPTARIVQKKKKNYIELRCGPLCSRLLLLPARADVVCIEEAA
jgi:hypothetical protein